MSYALLASSSERHNNDEKKAERTRATIIATYTDILSSRTSVVASEKLITHYSTQVVIRYHALEKAASL